MHLIYWSCSRKLDSSQRNNLLSANTRFKGKIRCIFCISSKRHEDRRSIEENTLLSKAVKICPAQSVIKLRFCSINSIFLPADQRQVGERRIAYLLYLHTNELKCPWQRMQSHAKEYRFNTAVTRYFIKAAAECLHRQKILMTSILNKCYLLLVQ